MQECMNFVLAIYCSEFVFLTNLAGYGKKFHPLLTDKSFHIQSMIDQKSKDADDNAGKNDAAFKLSSHMESRLKAKMRHCHVLKVIRLHMTLIVGFIITVCPLL